MDPLVSVDDLAAYLQRDLDLATAELAVASASGVVRDYCRWHIAPSQPDTLTLDGSGALVQTLPTLYVSDVASVSLDGIALTLASGAYPLPRGYTWSANGLLHRESGWPARYRCVQVSLTHGFPATPDGVAMVVLSVAARIVSNPASLKHRQVGGISDAFAVAQAATLGDVEGRVLDGYRIR